jgi:AraC-like DNA-binding protein
LEFYDARAGQLSFKSGADEIRPRTNHFGILYSPFSLCAPCFAEFKGHLIGFASMMPLPPELSSSPILFELPYKKSPVNLEEALERLKAAAEVQSVEINPKPSLLSLRTKKMIDENYLFSPSISKIAKKLFVTPEHLSRQFKTDFTMSPSNYLRLLRMADAPLRLAKGEEIANVSHEVGYNDLSRFYKQFRKTTETSPGACKTILRARSGKSTQ